ncbi:MAG: thiamine-monophosphate kinase [Candidatus Thorarchaeota archaeon]
MDNNLQIADLGENRLIELIEDLIFQKTGKALLRDDSFFSDISYKSLNKKLVLNSDMLVAESDVPPLMNYYQIGKKSVIMNISDLIVKGVKPKAIILSLGLPKEMKKQEFMELIDGVIDISIEFNMDYIGGDINESKDLIISPTVIGFIKPSKIIYRTGIQVGDILVSNNKFGLTGVGFDILLKRRGKPENYLEYQKSIMSVLEPKISSKEAYILTKKKLASASIDSSDGLYKSLEDLIISNPNIGFEIDFNEDLIGKEAVKYSREFNKPLEELVFNGGEEFIHLFIIKKKNIDKAQKQIKSKDGKIFKIGKVIAEKGIFISKDGKNRLITNYGFEHFVNRT